MAAPNTSPEKRVPGTGMDFIIVTDTREQQPYEFPCDTNRTKLEAGDYSVQGQVDAITVERKSLKDYLNTVLHAWLRFERELRKMREYPLSCIVVEADLEHIFSNPPEMRGISPHVVLGSALHIYVKHRIPVFFCGRRQLAREYTEGFLRHAARYQAGDRVWRK